MIDTRPKLITGAWPAALSDFLRGAQQELLLASPWITEGVAKYIAAELASLRPITVQILARMDEADFLNGSSHIASFRKETYPSHHRVIFRALPMLHGKMLVADRQRVIIGSANLTDGGLYRNHELSLTVDSSDVGSACAQEFFRLWSIASNVPGDYLDTLEQALADALPSSGEVDAAPRSPRKPRQISPAKYRLRSKYVSPSGASSARSLITKALRLSLPDMVAPEERDSALAWLERHLRFLPPGERNAPSVVERLERLMYHQDNHIRATAIDRAGRSGNRCFLPRLQALATNASEPDSVRSAAAFALALLGSPESFSTLSLLLAEGGHTARWARRGCFLLITEVDADGASWLLHTLSVDNPAAVTALARDCNVGHGTVSERLTKALIVEQLALGLWTDEEVAHLASIMVLTASAIRVLASKLNLLAIARFAAEDLGVATGDLRHGPLSAALLWKAAESGLTDPGLSQLLGEAWARYWGSPDCARTVLEARGKSSTLLRILGEALSSSELA